MYVGQLGDCGFAVNFDSKNVYLQKERLILIGNKYLTPELYYIYFYKPTHQPNFGNPTDLSLASLTFPIKAVS